MIDRTVAPGFIPVTDVKLQTAESYQLNNGIALHVINAGNQPVINLQLVFKAGKWYEKAPGTSLLLSKLMLEGTKKFSAKQINDYFDSHGVFWEITPGFDHFTIDIYLLTKFLHKISEIILSILSESLLPKNEFEVIKTRLRQQLTVNMEKTSYVASARFRNGLFGEDHAYGYTLDDKLLDRIAYEQVEEFYENQILNTKFEIIVAGNANQKVIEQISNEFSDLVLKAPSAPSLQPSFYAVKNSRYDEWQNSVQTSFRIGKIAPKKNTEDAIIFEVLNKILGGYFGSRLMRNLREEKGLTYGIHSSIAYLKNEAYFLIATDIIKEKRELALSEIYKEIEGLTSNKIETEELETVKNFMIGSFIKSINSPFSLAQLFKTVYYHNLNKHFFDSYVSEIRKVTSNDIINTAQKYFDGNFLEIAVG